MDSLILPSKISNLIHMLFVGTVFDNCYVLITRIKIASLMYLMENILGWLIKLIGVIEMKVSKILHCSQWRIRVDFAPVHKANILRTAFHILKTHRDVGPNYRKNLK